MAPGAESDWSAGRGSVASRAAQVSPEHTLKEQPKRIRMRCAIGDDEDHLRSDDWGSCCPIPLLQIRKHRVGPGVERFQAVHLEAVTRHQVAKLRVKLRRALRP